MADLTEFEPVEVDLPSAYFEDGRVAFYVQLEIAGSPGTYVDFTGHDILMQLKSSAGLAWEFSNFREQSNTQISISDNGTKIDFPVIESWPIIPNTYSWDLASWDSTGFKRTWIKGTIKVIQSISNV